MERKLRIITNVAFWQSETWKKAIRSIYRLDQGKDPTPRPWWREVISLWLRRPFYHLVITEGVRTSMGYAMLCLLTFQRSRQIMVEVFIDAAQPDNFKWRLKTWMHGCLARRAIGILTNSSTELLTMAKRYKMDPDRLRFVPLNSTIGDPARVPHDEGFVLSAGRTLRDYNTLLMAAQQMAAPLVIVCGQGDLDRVTMPLPPHVKVMQDIPRPEYLDLMKRCRVVALPLLPTERATGQVVMLEAMGYGKPVVTTMSPGTIDTIRNGENGFLVEEEDAAALAHRVNTLLRDHDLAKRVGEQAVADMKEMASAERHAGLKLKAIQELVDSAQRR